MPKPTFQRSTIARVLNAAPQLKYVAVYHTDDETCLYGFALPGAVYSVLEQQAKAANCTCSELLQVILERASAIPRR